MPVFRGFHLVVQLLFFGFFGFSQSSPQTAAKQLYEAIYNIDIDAVLVLSGLEFTPDRYKILDEVFQNEATKLRYSLTNAAFQVGEIKEIAGVNWCHIQYRNTIRVTYFSKLTDQQIADVKAELEKNFNTKQVTFEKQRQSFLIVYRASFVAKQQSNTWQIFVADGSLMTDLFEPCLPAEVKSTLGI
jgi:hypothetical protein